MISVLLFLCLVEAFARAQNACPADTGGPKYAAPIVAKGFTARVVISNLTRPRGMVFDTEGNLLVVQNRKEITAFSMATTGSCVKVTGKRTVLNAAVGSGESVGLSQFKFEQALKFDSVEPWYPDYGRWKNIVCIDHG
jgi:glucose/arabinose dehydrogenase